jgi:hypothetical protein
MILETHGSSSDLTKELRSQQHEEIALGQDVDPHTAEGAVDAALEARR